MSTFKKPRKQKYNAVRTKVGEQTCDSKIEAEHYSKLLIAEKYGEISDLILHPRFPLHVNGKKIGVCVLDFQFNDQGKTVYVDVKGVYIDFSRWKHAHFEAEYGHKVQIWKKVR